MTAPIRAEDSYAPIRDYAVVGDCHGAALVSKEGSVDWCSLERFDADPVFFKLLDARRGGFLSCTAPDGARFERTYEAGTNVLATSIRTAAGEVRLIDFMPVGRRHGAGIHNYVDLGAPGWFVRILEGVSGEVRLGVRFRPSAGLDRPEVGLARATFGVSSQPACLHGDLDFEIVPGSCASGAGRDRRADEARAFVDVRAGDRHCLVVASRPIASSDLAADVDAWLRVTRAFWKEWSCYFRYRGPHHDSVLRSALVLKLLTFAPTGALVAAPTTSLPEEIGGVRNWDYRFCWLRDSAFTLYALAALGYSGEARRFSHFLEGVVADSAPHIQPLYGLDGGADLPEREFGHLEGYRGSRPVRAGNAAAEQRQLDIFGSVLDWAWLYHELGGRFGDGMKAALRKLAAFVADHWQEPEAGIWEMRAEPRHHVYGKLMGYVALDRALRLFGSEAKLERARNDLLATVLERGTADGALVKHFGGTGADASLLLAPMLGLPIDPDLIDGTVRSIEEQLSSGEYLLRYRTDDGIAGGEGAFLTCSFWHVDALLHCGRAQDAERLLDRLCAHANDVGLFAEEIDPATDAFLGNFPQALTHLGLIQSAVHLETYKKHGRAGLDGTHADRARRNVGAVSGPRAIWEALKQTGRICRLVPSRASKVPASFRDPHAPRGPTGGQPS